MIRTGKEYLEALKDGREVWLRGRRVADVTAHPAFLGAIGARRRLYDLAGEAGHGDILAHVSEGERRSTLLRPPRTRQHWQDIQDGLELALRECGPETLDIADPIAAQAWSMLDCGVALAGRHPGFAHAARRHATLLARHDLLHATHDAWGMGEEPRPAPWSAPLRLLRESDAGIVLRGTRRARGLALADQTLLLGDTEGGGGDSAAPRPFGCILRAGRPGLRHIFQGLGSAPELPPGGIGLEEYTLHFDDVLIPFEDVLFLDAQEPARALRAAGGRYRDIVWLLRARQRLDLLLGCAGWLARQTRADELPEIRALLADLACFREGIRAHITAAIALGGPSPAGLHMPDQALLHAGRIFAGMQLVDMMQAGQELVAGQHRLLAAMSPTAGPEEQGWLGRFHPPRGPGTAGDRERLMAFARETLDSDVAVDQELFRLAEQACDRAGLLAVYHAFDFSGPLDLVRRCARLSDAALAGGMWE